MFNIFNSVLPIFLIITLGCLTRRRWLMSDEFWRGLENLSYFVLFPAALFNSISTVQFSFIDQAKLILAIISASVCVAASLMFYWHYKKLDRVQFTSAFQGSIRFNNYIFFGVGAALYGREGMQFVSIISAYMIIFTNVTSVIIFNIYALEDQSKKQHTLLFLNTLRKLMTNPLILASLAGFLFNHAQITIPTLFSNFLQSLAAAALTIGGMTVGSNLRFTWSGGYEVVAISVLCKIIILPLVTAVTLSMFGVTGVAKSIAILYSALPCASTSYMLSKQLGGDPDSMARIITITTFLSLLFLPIVMYILS